VGPAVRPRSQRDRWLTLIAVFKLVKAILLVAAGLGVLKLLQPGTAATVRDWVAALSVRRGQRILEQALGWATNQSTTRIQLVSVAAFAYAALFTTEGVGLWLARRWAEYLTVVATGSLIPFEVYELIRRLSVPRVVTLISNVAVVIYLIYRLRQNRHGQTQGAPAGARAGGGSTA
jgi:uncharacterized membrane protein (DUF2068 family)